MSRVLRLYKVVAAGQEVQFFNSKTAAKAARDRAIRIGREAYVRRGPDHKKGEMFAPNEATPEMNYG